MVISKLRDRLNPVIIKLVRFLDVVGIKPWQLTFSSLLLTIMSFLIIILQERGSCLIIIAIILFLLAGLMDGLDGALARYQGTASKWGAFYDSTIDRINEILFILALYIAGIINALSSLLYMSTSLIISYLRARAESLSVNIEGIGIMERGERIVLLCLVIILWLYFPVNINIAIYILVVLNVITIIERIYAVYHHLH